MSRRFRWVWLIALACLMPLSWAQGLPREVRDRVIEAVVEVVAWDDWADELVGFGGSGTIISPSGYILTNYHVIGDLDTRIYYPYQAIFVTLAEFTDRPPQHFYWAEYVAGDPVHDLALLKIIEFADGTPVSAELSLPSIVVGNSNELMAGDALTVVGYPGISGATITFTRGIMSGWVGEDRFSGGKQWIKTDAKMSGGNSGGAALNERGELVGIPTAGLELSAIEQQVYARPISLAWALIGPHVADVTSAQEAAVAAPLPPLEPPPGADTLPAAVSPPVGSGSYGAVAIGDSVYGSITGVSEDLSFVYHTYTVEVPAGLESLTIYVNGLGRDLDLAVKAGAEIMVYSEADYIDLSPEPNPSYTYLNPDPGVVYIDVLNLLPETAEYILSVTSEWATMGDALRFEPTLADSGESGLVDRVRIGQLRSGRLRGLDSAASYHTYVLEVPPGTSQVGMRLLATAELKLAIKHGAEITSYSDDGDWHDREVSSGNRKELILQNPEAGLWYIDVYNPLGSGALGSYTLTVY